MSANRQPMSPSHEVGCSPLSFGLLQSGWAAAQPPAAAISGARPRDRQSGRPRCLATSHKGPPVPSRRLETPCKRGFLRHPYYTAYYKIMKGKRPPSEGPLTCEFVAGAGFEPATSGLSASRAPSRQPQPGSQAAAHAAWTRRGVSCRLRRRRAFQPVATTSVTTRVQRLTRTRFAHEPDDGHPAGSSSRKMSHVQARPAVWFSQNPERWRSRRWPSPRVTGHLGHSHVSSPPIADYFSSPWCQSVGI